MNNFLKKCLTSFCKSQVTKTLEKCKKTKIGKFSSKSSVSLQGLKTTTTWMHFYLLHLQEHCPKWYTSKNHCVPRNKK